MSKSIYFIPAHCLGGTSPVTVRQRQYSHMSCHLRFSFLSLNDGEEGTQRVVDEELRFLSSGFTQLG
jgi:hypothetical protein